jgi:hypothetical protein
LRWTCATAIHRMTLAVTFVERLPATLDALAAGEINLPRARAIAEATMNLSDEHAGQVEAQVLARAGGQNSAEVRRAARRAAISGAPPPAPAKPADLAGPTNSACPAKPADAAEPAQPADPADPAEQADPAARAEPANQANPAMSRRRGLTRRLPQIRAVSRYTALSL